MNNDDLVFVMDAEGAAALDPETALSYDASLADLKQPAFLYNEAPWLDIHNIAKYFHGDLQFKDGRRAFDINPNDFKVMK